MRNRRSQGSPYRSPCLVIRRAALRTSESVAIMVSDDSKSEASLGWVSKLVLDVHSLRHAKFNSSRVTTMYNSREQGRLCSCLHKGIATVWRTEAAAAARRSHVGASSEVVMGTCVWWCWKLMGECLSLQKTFLTKELSGDDDFSLASFLAHLLVRKAKGTQLCDQLSLPPPLRYLRWLLFQWLPFWLINSPHKLNVSLEPREGERPYEILLLRIGQTTFNFRPFLWSEFCLVWMMRPCRPSTWNGDNGHLGAEKPENTEFSPTGGLFDEMELAWIHDDDLLYIIHIHTQKEPSHRPLWKGQMTLGVSHRTTCGCVLCCVVVCVSDIFHKII